METLKLQDPSEDPGMQKITSEASNGAVNGQPKNAHRFNPHFTQTVIDATGPKALPRLKQVLPSLIQHMHDFCRENEITTEEWMAAVDLVGYRLISSFIPKW